MRAATIDYCVECRCGQLRRVDPDEWEGLGPDTEMGAVLSRSRREAKTDAAE